MPGFGFASGSLKPALVTLTLLTVPSPLLFSKYLKNVRVRYSDFKVDWHYEHARHPEPCEKPTMYGSSLHHSIVANQEDSDPEGGDWLDGTIRPQIFPVSGNPGGILDGQAPHAHYMAMSPPETPPDTFMQVNSPFSQEAMGIAPSYDPAHPFQRQDFGQEFPTLVTDDESLAPGYRQNESASSEDFYHGDRSLPPELIHGYGIFDEEGPQYREETPQPHDTAAEPQVHVGDTLVPPQTLDAGEHAGQLPPHPVGPEADQVATLVLTESSPVTTRIQRPRKRKRKPTSDKKEGEVKRPRRPRKPRNPEDQTYIPDPDAPPPNRPGLFPLAQTEYQCDTAQRGRKHHPPIDFTTSGGVQGINLEDAFDMNFPDLDGRDDPMFVDGSTGSSISLRIELVGHQLKDEDAKARQIATKDHRMVRDPIRRQKLGYEIAKLIEEYLMNGKNAFPVPLEYMYLVRLHNVSRASWQPELWYKIPQAASTSS